MGSTLGPSHNALSARCRWLSQSTCQQIGEKECLADLQHRSSSDIAAELPKRQSFTKLALHTTSGATLPTLKEAFVTRTPSPLKTWVVVANITDELSWDSTSRTPQTERALWVGHRNWHSGAIGFALM
jgi:hypothetical protein